MKKICIIVMVMSIIFNVNLFAFASEYNNFDNEITNLEINYLKKSISSYNIDIEKKADIFLKECGMDSKWITGIPIELRTCIFENCLVAGKYEEFALVDENGNEKNISKSTFELQKLAITNNSSNTRDNDENPKVVSDSYLKKSLYWYYLDDGSGYYIFMVTYEWLRLPVIRNADVLTMSATSGAFVDGTSGCYFSYTQTVAQSGTIDTTTYEYSYDENSDNYCGINCVAYKIDLPKDVPGISISVNNTELNTMIYSGYYVQHPELITNFNLYSNYFHRTMAIGSSFSLDLSGGQVSIDPESFYRPHTIDKTFNYIPV